MAEQHRNSCVWFEIPCTDLDAAKKFYETVLGVTMTRIDDEPNPIVCFTSLEDEGVSGHLYPGAPAPRGAGATIHLSVKDKLEDAMARVRKAGGKVVSDIIALPAGRFVYCEDLDTNSIALFSA